MTNPPKKALEVWTSLKTKLQPLIYLHQHKSLIKDALEFHLLQTSSFLMGSNYHQVTFDLPRDWTITSLTEPTEPLTDQTGKLTQEWKEYLEKKRWNSCLKQQERNEKVVKECKELLSKLA